MSADIAENSAGICLQEGIDFVIMDGQCFGTESLEMNF